MIGAIQETGRVGPAELISTQPYVELEKRRRYSAEFRDLLLPLVKNGVTRVQLELGVSLSSGADDDAAMYQGHWLFVFCRLRTNHEERKH